MAQRTQYHVSRISNEHSDWNRSILFYKDELIILDNRLSEVSRKYTNENVKSQVEHFQNQFIIQKNNLDGLKLKIKDHEKHMSDDTLSHAQHLTDQTILEHSQLHDQFITQEKIIIDLKTDFYRFLSHYM